MKETFDVFDWHRIFIGNAPLGFLLEIVFRTVFMYLYTISLLRLLGKRGMGQLSSLELAIIICFGSAVGDPMIGKDVPIIYGLISITTIALLQIGIERLINRHKKLEVLMEGKADLLVDNGIIIIEALRFNNLSHADLFRILRGKDVKQLGEIDKAFFETSGQITVWLHPHDKISRGLSLMPEEELPLGALLTAPVITQQKGSYSCTTCGTTIFTGKNTELQNCRNCGNAGWLYNDLIR